MRQENAHDEEEDEEEDGGLALIARPRGAAARKRRSVVVEDDDDDDADDGGDPAAASRQGRGPEIDDRGEDDEDGRGATTAGRGRQQRHGAEEDTRQQNPVPNDPALVWNWEQGGEANVQYCIHGTWFNSFSCPPSLFRSRHRGSWSSSGCGRGTRRPAWMWPSTCTSTPPRASGRAGRLSSIARGRNTRGPLSMAWPGASTSRKRWVKSVGEGSGAGWCKSQSPELPKLFAADSPAD